MIIGATSAEHFNNEQQPLLMNDILLLLGRMHGSFWAVARRLHSDSFIFCVLLIKSFRDSYLETVAELHADLAPDTTHWCSSPLDKCCVGCFFFFFPPSSSFVLLNDGEDKKRDDIDGERSAQSRRREEALRHAWKFSAGGPGKLSAQRTAKPENNFGFPPWKSWGHPDERQIWNWQSFRHAPQQREYLFGGDFVVRKQEENEPLLRSFARFRY